VTRSEFSIIAAAEDAVFVWRSESPGEALRAEYNPPIVENDTARVIVFRTREAAAIDSQFELAEKRKQTPLEVSFDGVSVVSPGEDAVAFVEWAASMDAHLIGAVGTDISVLPEELTRRYHQTDFFRLQGPVGTLRCSLNVTRRGVQAFIIEIGPVLATSDERIESSRVQMDRDLALTVAREIARRRPQVDGVFVFKQDVHSAVEFQVAAHASRLALYAEPIELEVMQYVANAEPGQLADAAPLAALMAEARRLRARHPEVMEVEALITDLRVSFELAAQAIQVAQLRLAEQSQQAIIEQLAIAEATRQDTERANRQSTRFQRSLALIGSLLLAPTLVASVFGANVRPLVTSGHSSLTDLLALMVAGALLTFVPLRVLEGRVAIPGGLASRKGLTASMLIVTGLLVVAGTLMHIGWAMLVVVVGLALLVWTFLLGADA
jgi:hypothetical protein